MHKFVRPVLLGIALSAVMTVGAAAAYEGVGTVTCDVLNLRAEPNTESEVLAHAMEEDVVLIMETVNDQWYKVDYCTIQGYVSADHLTVETTYDQPLAYGRVDIQSGTLNIRADATTDSAKVGSLQNRALLPLNAFKDGWFKTEMNGVVGYVSGDYVTVVNGEGKRADEPVLDAASLERQIVDYAKQFLGTPYIYGGSTPSGFDCSGFTSYVYRHFGYSLTRTSASQLSNGRGVSLEELRPGDLICFRSYGSSKAATHVGIYVGDNQYIHSPRTGDVVKISDLSTATSDKAIVGYRRII